MAVYYKTGSLLEATDVDYICHQVNCQGKMNSGIAKAIRDKWPTVYEDYHDRCTQLRPSHFPLLGTIQVLRVSNTTAIINMFSQEHYGYDGKRYTSYDAFWGCLHYIKRHVPPNHTIGFPDHIGCCRGGANWEVIKTMIEQVLGSDFDVYIYKLEV